MIRRFLRLTSPGVFVTVLLHGTTTQRVAVGLGVVLFGVGLGVILSLIFGHLLWALVMLLGWAVCEVGARDFERSRKGRS